MIVSKERVIEKNRKVILDIEFILVILGLIAVIYFATSTHILSYVPSPAVIGVCLEILSVCFATVLFQGFFFVKTQLTKSYILLATLLFFNDAALILDIFSISLMGNPVNVTPVLILNVFYYACGNLISLVGLWYINSVAGREDRVNRVLLIAGSVIGIIGVIADFVNLWYGIFFTIDENANYVRAIPTYYLGYWPPVLLLIIIGIFIIRSKLKAGKKMALTTYLLILVSSTLLQTFFKDFSFTYMGILCGLVLLYVNVQMDNVQQEAVTARELAEARAELAENNMNLMQSQMQPHFLYNCMVSIRRLITKDPIKAQEAMDYFMQYLRANVDMLTKGGLIPVMEELDFVKSYLELEKIRFGEKVDYTLEINEDNFSVPPMAVQTLVENAIKHGIRKTPTGEGTVRITTGRTETYYYVEVKDNGVGIDGSKPLPSDKNKVGIANTRERVARLAGGYMKQNGKIGKGSTFYIYIPIEEGK